MHCDNGLFLADLSECRNPTGRFDKFPLMFSGQFCPFQMFLGVQTNSGFIDRHSNYVPLPVGDCCFLSGDEPHAGAAFNDSNTRIFGEASSKVGRGYGPLSQHFFDEEIATHLSASSSVI